MVTRTESRTNTGITEKCLGEQLTLTCRTNQDQILTWDVYIPYYSMFYTKLIANEGVRDMQTVQVDPTVTLTFDRTSESNILPLVSQLTINNITGRLNETKINRTEHSLGNTILQKEIYIIDTNNSKHRIICNTFYIAIFII